MEPVDLVLPRNVLIYFGMDMKRSVLRRARSVLRSDGCLLVGSAETALHVDGAFVPVMLGESVCYRLREGLGR